VEEIRDAVWLYDGSKSPGPNGFNLFFVKESWEVFKDALVEAMALFHETGCIPKGCNTSFVALIPKVRDPAKLERYRPISLVGVMYKVISKVLAERIKKVLPVVIDECQSAFLKDRCILDSVLSANEVIEDLRRRRMSGLCFKVDFEKAYDSVSWDFLYDMLQRLGFHCRWIMWIKGCLTSASVSVLVNGSPTEEFYPSRGLRQGDPLAPFLFLVVAEGLAGLVRQAVKVNLYAGLHIGRSEVDLCMLQFADDTLFLCQDAFSNVFTLKAILRGFEVASGLKINFHKSKLAGINVCKSNMDCYTKTLNCSQMEVPFIYLGIEVGGNPRKKKFWEPVLRKLKSRLSVWKGRFLSMAGRLCLINSILSAIPLYYLSLFKAPEVVCKSIISIQRRFLWGWGKESRPVAWIKWEDICKSKGEGGLGIRDIRKFNHAMLAKWKWRCISDDKGRWREVLDSKYGMDPSNARVPMKYQSWKWRDLMKVCREGGGDGWFQEQVGWKIGGGDKVRFWEDAWVGNSNLKTLYPRLFSLSLNQGQKVEEVGVWDDLVWRWSLTWRRSIFEWESLLESELVNHISRVSLRKDVEDTQVWKSDEFGRFSVKSTYEFLAKSERGSQKEVFSILWKTKTFPNVLITTWRALLGRLPTRLGLSRRGIVLNTTMCALCLVEEESCQHLFVECKCAHRVWNKCFKWIGIFSVQHKDIAIHFEGFSLSNGSKKQNMVWRGVWAAIVRSLWEHRNDVVFNEGVVDEDEVLHKAQLKSLLWLKHKGHNFCYSFSDWVMNPWSCISSYK